VRDIVLINVHGKIIKCSVPGTKRSDGGMSE